MTNIKAIDSNIFQNKEKDVDIHETSENQIDRGVNNNFNQYLIDIANQYCNEISSDNYNNLDNSYKSEKSDKKLEKKDAINQNEIEENNLMEDNKNNQYEENNILQITNKDIDNKENNHIEEKNIQLFQNENLLFNGKLFKINRKTTNYKRKDNIKRIIFKCCNNRKDEALRESINKKSFCNATIEYIYPEQNIKSGYFLKHPHSIECNDIYDNKPKIVDKKSKDKEKFIEECHRIMNSSDIYDRRLFKEEFMKIYNNSKYNFPITNNLLSNIISKWKNISNRFNKTSVLFNPYDYQNRLILREYRTLYIIKDVKIKPSLLEYIIWSNEENIKRIRKAKHYFIDSTFHHPPEFKQLLIVMYKDIITDLKIPGIYILMNEKSENLYDIVFNSIFNLITNNGKIDINVISIVTDTEIALINSIRKYFPNTQRIACFFHYNQDILRNMKLYKLYNKDDKETSDLIRRELSILPIIYNGNINMIINKVKNLQIKYPYYDNYLENYFLENKLCYFKDESLFYQKIPKDCRTNNYLENYNGFIKQQLGKRRLINWINFLDFIKKESQRSIDKLMNSQNNNKIYFKDETIPLLNNNEEQIIIDASKLPVFNENKNLNKNFFEKKEKTYLLENEKNSLTEIIYSTKGILNVGNTCYVNALIQVLFHSYQFIVQFANCKEFNKDNIFNISNKLYNIITKISFAINNKEEYIDISDLLYLFEIKHPTFKTTNQNDTQEFCRILLDDLEKELNSIKMRPTYHELTYEKNITKLDFIKVYEDYQNERVQSIIKDIFYTKIIYKYVCECKKELYSCQYMTDIPLLLDSKSTHIKLDVLLEKYFKEETIKFERQCD